MWHVVMYDYRTSAMGLVTDHVRRKCTAVMLQLTPTPIPEDVRLRHLSQRRILGTLNESLPPVAVHWRRMPPNVKVCTLIPGGIAVLSASP